MLINELRHNYTSHNNVNANFHRIQPHNNKPPPTHHHHIHSNPTLSPRSFPNPHPHQSHQYLGQQMRMMKSKLINTTLQQKNILNQNNLYPSQLIFVLSNEEGNVDHIKKLIDKEKKRVDRDFDNFIRSIIHIIEDLKSSIYAQLNTIFINFIDLYKNMKSQVIKMKQTRRKIITSLTNIPPQLKLSPKTQLHQHLNHNLSNLNLLQQISQDQDYYRHHRLYQQISTAYNQSIGPILSNVQNILLIGSQQQFYHDQQCKSILDHLHNQFYQNMKIIYQQKLHFLVTQVRTLIDDNNMLLKGLTIDELKPDKNDEYTKTNQPPKQSKQTITPIPDQPKKKKLLFELNPYGLQQSQTYKNKIISNDQSNNKLKNSRPTSNSVDNLKIKIRYNQFISPTHRQLQQYNKKYYYHQNISTRIKTTKDQQNIIIQFAQEPSLIQKHTSIISKTSQNILLCILFINDGKHLAVGSKDNNIYIYQVLTAKLIQTLTGHQASICTLSNFGPFFASGGDSGCGSLILWQSDSLRLKTKTALHSAALTCIVDLTDGIHLATGGYDKKILIFNYKTNQQLFELNSCRSGITSMIICQKSHKLISSCLDSTLSIWNISIINNQLQKITLQKIINNCGFICSMRPLMLLPDIVLIGNKQGKLIMLNIYSGQPIKTIPISKGSIIQMTVIERNNKAYHPIILSCCNGQRQLLWTNFDTGCNQLSKANNNVSYGCGIGPKIVSNEQGIVAVVNQNLQDKSVDFYQFCIK